MLGRSSLRHLIVQYNRLSQPSINRLESESTIYFQSLGTRARTVARNAKPVVSGLLKAATLLDKNMAIC
jgi:hypothetical protein